MHPRKRQPAPADVSDDDLTSSTDTDSDELLEEPNDDDACDAEERRFYEFDYSSSSDDDDDDENDDSDSDNATDDADESHIFGRGIALKPVERARVAHAHQLLRHDPSVSLWWKSVRSHSSLFDTPRDLVAKLFGVSPTVVAKAGA